MLYILIIITGAVCWSLFFSKSVVVGKYLYIFNIWYYKKVAGLIEKRITVNGEQFVYLSNQQANKSNMILLHGFSADKNIWLKFACLASKDYHLIIPDLLGHGDIVYQKQQSYSAYEQAKYTARLINAIDLHDSLIIVGNSMGGMIAAILGSQQNVLAVSGHEHDKNPYLMPKINISRIVLLDPAGVKSNLITSMEDQGFNPFSHHTQEDVFNFYKLTMYKPPFIPPAVLTYLAHDNYLAKQAQYQHMFKDFFNQDEFFDAPLSIDANVLLIWGEKDALLPVSDVEKWRQIVDCEHIILPGIGHMPMVEDPAKTYSLVK